MLGPKNLRPKKIAGPKNIRSRKQFQLKFNIQIFKKIFMLQIFLGRIKYCLINLGPDLSWNLTYPDLTCPVGQKRFGLKFNIKIFPL